MKKMVVSLFLLVFIFIFVVFVVNAQNSPTGSKLNYVASCDANGDGGRDLSDAISFLGFLFQGGDQPSANVVEQLAEEFQVTEDEITRYIAREVGAAGEECGTCSFECNGKRSGDSCGNGNVCQITNNRCDEEQPGDYQCHCITPSSSDKVFGVSGGELGTTNDVGQTPT